MRESACSPNGGVKLGGRTMEKGLHRARFGLGSARLLLVAGLILLLASPLFAHNPPPVYLTVDVTEEELKMEVTLSKDLFKDWFPLAVTPRGDLRKTWRNHVAGQITEWATVKIDRLPVKGVVGKAEEKKFLDHGIEWEYVVIDVTYGVKGKPRQVAVTWTKYTTSIGWELDPIDAEFEGFEGGAYVQFTKREPEVVWHTPRAPRVTQKAWEPPVVEPETVVLPLASFGCALALLLTGGFLIAGRVSPRLGGVAIVAFLAAGAGLWGRARIEVAPPWAASFEMPAGDQAKLIFETLHRNIYRAFDYESEDDIYDTLARSVTGNLLEDVYLEVYDSLIMKEAGGAVAKVQSTRIVDAEVDLPDDLDARHYDVKCKWRVVGKVGHHGHTHRRTNEYRAVYTVTHVAEKGWRIAAVTVLDQKRVEDEQPEGWTDERDKR
jgi:hypothetical protein